jgi:5-(carboxyamino)imidazole ribonucleotide synthase
MHIGILGAGQLGRMIALAGVPLGAQFRFLDPAPNGPAARLGRQLAADYTDEHALAEFAEGLDLITYEFENVPGMTAEYLAARVSVFPPPMALAAAQDRLIEKQFFQRLDIPTAPFLPVSSRAELVDAAERLGLPAILKTRRLGYDGKGQLRLHSREQIAQAWDELGGQDLILEGFVPFVRELSVIAVRGRDGATACYPLVENTHRQGILRRSVAPAPTTALQVAAESYAARALDALGYVGVLAIELFETGQNHGTAEPQNQGPGTKEQKNKRTKAGSQQQEQHEIPNLQFPISNLPSGLLVNEMAPRVHNSGHWTIEGSETSQFENHLRAVMGLPLGSTAMRGHAAMVNLIGEIPDHRAVLAVPGAHLHLYEKAPRPGRKVGHVTLRADDHETLMERVGAIEALLTAGG